MKYKDWLLTHKHLFLSSREGCPEDRIFIDTPSTNAHWLLYRGNLQCHNYIDRPRLPLYSRTFYTFDICAWDDVDIDLVRNLNLIVWVTMQDLKPDDVIKHVY